MSPNIPRSCLMRAKVGVIGSVLAPPGGVAVLLMLNVFSVLILCWWLLPEGVEGVAGGRVAAVHVSVTLQSSDLILVT